MIFYFTGTGNSLHAAKMLLREGEALISMPEAIKAGTYDYEVRQGETVGFVFPVYFYTLPDIVKNFITALTLHGADYVYAVITCGGGISQTGGVLKKYLRIRGVELNYVSELLMPDNAMLFYQISPVSEAGERLKNADRRLLEIAEDIRVRKTVPIGSSTLVSDMMGLGYFLSSGTAKYYADENCNGCGKCARNCPQDVIQMENGKPKWVKDRCSKCSACICRCPNAAIQYGRRTKKRNRYLHPELEK